MQHSQLPPLLAEESLSSISEARTSLGRLEVILSCQHRSRRRYCDASCVNKLEKGICSRYKNIHMFSDTEVGNKGLEQRRQATFSTSECIT